MMKESLMKIIYSPQNFIYNLKEEKNLRLAYSLTTADQF